jgi:hypothetical protein
LPTLNKNKNKDKNMTYSSSIALQRKQTGFGRNQNAVSFRSTDRTLGPISSTITLIVLAMILGLIYLTQVTKMNAYGYKIDSLRTEQAQLTAAHEDLEVAQARLKSLDRVQNSDVAKAMVSVAPSATISQ